MPYRNTGGPRVDPARLYDTRTIERTIRRGDLARKDYQKHLKSLPDVADKAVPCSLDGGEDATRAETTD